MDPTPLPTIEPFIPAEHAVPQETINDGLLFLRETLASIKQDGAYGTIILYAANPAEKPVPTIMFGFPIPPRNLPAVRHPPLPILLLQDGVSPSGLTSLRPSWVNEIVMHNKIQISNNSLGLQNNVEGGGSFGGWLKDGPGRIYGLTCYHNLPGFKQGGEIVSPSTLEVTAKLQVTIDGTTYSAHPRKRLSPCLTKTVEYLLAQYSLRENPSGVPLADGRVVTLSGPPLGRVIDGRLHNNALFLERHNLRLPPYAKFAVLPQAKSHLDFAIFQVSPERHGGNWVSLSGLAIDGPVTAVGDFRPGDIVTKIGRTTAKTDGKVNGVGIVIWHGGEETSEIMILASGGARVGEQFADLGDSGSMVFRSNADDGYEALGMVVAKNISAFPAWVAATPYWVLIEEAGNLLEEELYLGESGDGGDCDIGEGDGPENQSTR